MRLREDGLRIYGTQVALAEASQINEYTMSRWLGGSQVPNPRLSQLEVIASALGLTVSELLDGQTPPRAVVQSATSEMRDAAQEAAAMMAEALRLLGKFPR